MAVTPLNKGSASPDKKRMVILFLLGVVIIIVYKKTILDRSQSSSTPEISGVVKPSQPLLPPPLAEGTTPRIAVPGVPLVSAPPAPESASWGRDPFVGTYYEEEKPVSQPPEEKQAAVQHPQKSESEMLLLSGIGWSRNRALAIINGQVVHEGEIIATKEKKRYKVISILKNRVVVDHEGITIILRVRGGR